MRVLFRVDASTQIGSGHVMRCLALAQCLRKTGADCEFVCREFSGHLCGIIEQHGFVVNKLPYFQQEETTWLGESWETDAHQLIDLIKGSLAPFHWVIVDHYAIDARWEKAVLCAGVLLMVIDDLDNRDHACHVLLDQNAVCDYQSRYKDRVSSQCLCLLGLKYALLRHDFVVQRQRVNPRQGPIKRVLVFFGGVDAVGLTLQSMQVLFEKYSDFQVDVVVGNANPLKDHIAQTCLEYHFSYHLQIQNMAELMANADLSIGAGGTTTWERFCLGLPSIVTPIADNQLESVAYLEKNQLIFVCNAETNYKTVLAQKLEACRAFPEDLRRMSYKIFDLVDGKGCDRVVDILKGYQSLEN